MVARMWQFLENQRVFRSPYAPSLVATAARLVKSSERVFQGEIYVFGKGFDRKEADLKLLGEAAERDALFLKTGDKIRKSIDLVTGASHDIAANLVMCGDPADPVYPGSTGCAAHCMFEVAAVSAIRELIERRSVYLWWNRQTRAVQLSDDWLHRKTDVGMAIERARAGAFERRETEFYVLNQNQPVLVIAAKSAALDGGQIAVAYATASNIVTACKRAFLELLSVELETADLHSAHLHGQTIEEGSGRALVAQRQKAFRTTHMELFDVEAREYTAVLPKPENLLVLLQNCESFGEPVALVDLTRPEIGLPVCRAIYQNPALQPVFPRGNELSPL